MILQLKRRGKEEKITINLYDVPHNDIYDIPAGKELVYSDNEYKFILPKSAGKPSEVSVNDDTYEVDELKPSGENISFSIGRGNTNRKLFYRTSISSHRMTFKM